MDGRAGELWSSFTRQQRVYVQLAGLAALAVGASALLGRALWPQPDRTIELCGLVLAAILVSVLAPRTPPADNWGTAPASFVVDFAALLLVGPEATMLVVVAGLVTSALLRSRATSPLGYLLSSASAALVATQAAGLVYRVLGGTMGGPGKACRLRLRLPPTASSRASLPNSSPRSSRTSP